MSAAAKIQALALHLDCDPSEITSGFNEGDFSHGTAEWRVLTDEEADAACAEYIRESAWAFNVSFIARYTKYGLSTEAQDALAKAQEALCEKANELVLALVQDEDLFISDAILEDGRGHFLSHYDHEEVDIAHENQKFFAYRVN